MAEPNQPNPTPGRPAPGTPGSKPSGSKSSGSAKGKPSSGGKGGSMPEAATQEQVPHHKSARQRRGRKKGNMDLNLTSMIDVTFQLLIYFIITAAFSAGEGILTAKFPQGTGQSAAKDPPKRPLNIRLAPHLDENGLDSYRLDVEVRGTPVGQASFEDLYTWLRSNNNAINSAGPYPDDNPVIIKPQNGVRWTYVVNAFNAAIKAGYKNVAFAQAGGG